MDFDRISDLPDELLCYILSYLPTKLAFTTTILSKRWSTPFHSLSVLRIDFNSQIRSPSIKDSASFNRFLDRTLQRRVEQLHLTLYFSQILNPNFLNSSTLTYLKLHDLTIGRDTSCVHLPSLKTLDLSFVFFTNRNDYINFLSACPNLEDLHAESIYYCMKHDENKNNTPEEEEEEFTLSKLVRASIDLKDVMFNVFKNVEFLCLITSFMEQDSFKVIPLFQNLIHIELVYCSSNWSYCWDDVVNLLQHCPKIQILFINKWISEEWSSSEEWKYPISVIECVSLHLRSCTILNFQNFANDFRFAKYILQNASLLQDMTIGVATREMLVPKSQIIAEFSSISSRCKPSFEFQTRY